MDEWTTSSIPVCSGGTSTPPEPPNDGPPSELEEWAAVLLGHAMGWSWQKAFEALRRDEGYVKAWIPLATRIMSHATAKGWKRS